MFATVSNYIKGSVSEFRKVVWPTRKEVISHTIIIIVSIIIVAFFTAIVDYLLGLLVDHFIL